MTPKEHALYLLGLATGRALRLRSELQTEDRAGLVTPILEALWEARNALMKVDEIDGGAEAGDGDGGGAGDSRIRTDRN